MRPTPKISVCLVVSCVGLLFVFCNSVWPQQTKKANPRIKELQQKRLAVLEEAQKVAANLYANARIGFEQLRAVNVELFAARRDYAETRKDRIKACDDSVQEALTWIQIAQAKKEFARESGLSELSAQAFLLEAQIARENAEIGE